MLSILRRKAQSPIIQAIVVLIAVVFIFWGAGSSQNGSQNTVATVNEYPIPYQEFQQAYDRVLTSYRDQLGGNLPVELVKQLGIEGQVINQLISDVLLRQGAAEMGIMVSDIEVKNAVQELGAFSSNGQFDMNQYKAVLSQSRLTPAAFEENMRSDLLSSKVMQSLARFTDVLPAEIMERFIYESEELKFAYLSFGAEDFRDKVELGEEKIAGYYEKNKNNYKTDKQIKLNYLVFPFNDDREQVQVSTEDLLAYYQQNIDNYIIPEKRLASHILIQTLDEDREEVLANKRQRAEEVLAMARSDSDFAALAQKYSEGPSAAAGGSLGYLVRGEQTGSFDEAVFSLAVGGISELVETGFGFHIIKVEDIQPGRTRDIEEVRDELAAEIRGKAVGETTFARASQAYENIILAGNIDKYSESSGMALLETGFFERKSPPADAGAQAFVTDPTFLNAAFSLMKGELSSLVATEKGFAIIYAKEIMEPEVLPLDGVRESLVKAYVDEQSDLLAREAADKLLAAARTAHEKGSGWEEEIKSLGLAPLDSGYIARRDTAVMAKLNLPASLIQKVSGLSAENPYPEEIEAWGGTYYVYRFSDRRDPTADIPQEKEAEIKAGLMKEKGLGLLSGWLENRKNNSEIVINEQFLPGNS